MRVLAILISMLAATCFADSGASLYGAGHGVAAVGGGYTASYVSHSVGYAAGTVTEVVVTPPASITDGGMLVAFTSSEAASQTITPPDGFTVIDAPANSFHDAASYYKIASSESGNYTWTFGTSTSGLVVHMYFISKSGGTWVVPTTTNYHNAGTSDGSTGESTGNVVTQDNSVLVCGFSNDSTATIDTAPASMTDSGYQAAGTMGGAAYYQEYSSGTTVAKTAVWTGSAANIAMAVVLYAQ